MGSRRCRLFRMELVCGLRFSLLYTVIGLRGRIEDLHGSSTNQSPSCGRRVQFCYPAQKSSGSSRRLWPPWSFLPSFCSLEKWRSVRMYPKHLDISKVNRIIIDEIEFGSHIISAQIEKQESHFLVLGHFSSAQQPKGGGVRISIHEEYACPPKLTTAFLCCLPPTPPYGRQKWWNQHKIIGSRSWEALFPKVGHSFSSIQDFAFGSQVSPPFFASSSYLVFGSRSPTSFISNDLHNRPRSNMFAIS